MAKTIYRLPYKAPDTSAVEIVTEQSIATGSDKSSGTLGNMGGTGIYDEEFNPIP